ncbi:efflux transporter outer membrane subunit [Bradyrhizobium sp. ARR65]|uniref:efflux transporter outer membrane subunit n=1 Tax=Bradyrhizobium sp. ARR65 TaxID=1040989 RepID=UPI0004654ACF|nr:efflux transporter outer membrane subunit [Bradyrhizobium sp. ARR65]
MRGPAHRLRRAVSGMPAAAVTLVLALATSGCVGPNFVPPAAPAVDGYLPGKLASPGPTPSAPKVPAQHFVTGEAVSARWWAAFRSQPLNDLIRDAVNHSPTLQSAEAAIKIAQFNAEAQRGLWSPQVTGNSMSQQILQSNAGTVFGGDISAVPQTQFSLITHQLTVSFVPDVWGANFRQVENLDAVTEQQLFMLEAAYLTLTSNVVTAAIQEASFRGQITETKRVIEIERHLLDILKRQFDAGQAAKSDVLAQEAALAAAEQLLPPLEKQLSIQRDLLTALAGRLSSDEVAEKFDLAHMKLPANLPISLPSKLVDQRPDVRQAEANMHSASALIGVAIAARLPNFTLSANGGTSAYNFAQSFVPGTGFYTLTAGVTAPIFDGFTLYNKQKAAEAGLDQAEAQYRATVITAFQNVADALRALQADARAVQAALHAEETAKASLDIVEKQLQAGQVNQLAVLNAQQTYLTAVVTRVQAQATRLSDTAALFMALGGGWPTTCTSPVWRECAVGQAAPASPDQPQPVGRPL